jgi:hypothetical protein
MKLDFVKTSVLKKCYNPALNGIAFVKYFSDRLTPWSKVILEKLIVSRIATRLPRLL